MSAVASIERRFPDAVWDVPVLRGLDDRARRELEAAGRVREVARGASVHRGGEPADALYVVVSGACEIVAVRRGDTKESVIRRVGPGEVFGEEAIVTTFATRALAARAASPSRLVEIPIAVLRRAVGRSGGEVLARHERALVRAATLDLLRTTSFAHAASERDLELLLDAVRHVHLARGEHLYRAGEVSTEAFVVADGLLSVQSTDDGKPRVEAYLSRGDLAGDEELERREPGALSVVASGPAWLVAIPRDVFVPIARRSGGRENGTRRLRTLPVVKPPPGMQTTAHVLADVYRMRVARSLLVIDQDSCIRCGHCAWSCASVHDDGISRLVRHGDKVVVRAQADEARDVAPLLVPNSCQHCKNPACMIDCPTGAIGRDAGGEVFIREELCTGCGACAKACPWDNIQIARRSSAGPYPDVAVKCDLCAGSAAGPACVSSCPTEAIARIDPNVAFEELRALARDEGDVKGAVLPPRRAGWPWTVGATAAAIGLALVPLGRGVSGVIAGLAFTVLLGTSVAKRLPRLVARVPGLPVARALYVGHVAIGVLLAGITLAHTGWRLPANAAGALLGAMIATVATGVLGAIVHVVVPRRLARLERKSVLPEELRARGPELDERIFERLTGRTELVKTLFARVLRPYRRARLGGLSLALSGRSVRAEERRLRARVDALLEGRRSERLVGLDDLVKLVVERRAVVAQRILTFLLRGWLVPHVAATGAAIVLLVLHVLATRGRP